VEADADVQTRVDKIREYFYGPSGDLSPHSTLIDFADISIYRIGGGPRAPSSALPIGAERTITPTKLVEVQPSQEIVHSIIGVSHAKTPEALLETNLAGFLYMYAPPASVVCRSYDTRHNANARVRDAPSQQCNAHTTQHGRQRGEEEAHRAGPLPRTSPQPLCRRGRPQVVRVKKPARRLLFFCCFISDRLQLPTRKSTAVEGAHFFGGPVLFFFLSCRP
jgi:hypothetical protein